MTGWRIMPREDDVDEGLRVSESVRDNMEDAVDVGVCTMLNGEGHSCGDRR